MKMLFKIKFPMSDQTEESKKAWSPKVRAMLEARDFYYIGREKRDFRCGCSVEDAPPPSPLGIAEFVMPGPCGPVTHAMGLGQCPACSAVYWSVWGIRADLWDEDVIKQMAQIAEEADDRRSPTIIQ